MKNSMLVKLSSLLFVMLSNSSSHAITLNQYLNSGPILTPPGNIGRSVKKSTNMSKFYDILGQLTEETYGCVIRQASQAHGVDPVAIMGSIIGEHTYNVNAWDYWGERYVYMSKKWVKRFSADGLDVIDLLNEDQYRSCKTLTDNNYDLWDCYNAIWKKDRRNGRRKKSVSWDLKWTFFNPMGSGYTYGLGQLGPVRALMVTDIVARNSGFPELSLSHPETIYDHILNPQTSIHYVAASNRVAIDLYKQLANFDISRNPGVIATLFNLGRESQKANEKYKQTVELLEKGKSIVLPKSNYYGWLINEQEAQIRAQYQQKIAPLSDKTCRKHVL